MFTLCVPHSTRIENNLNYKRKTTPTHARTHACVHITSREFQILNGIFKKNKKKVTKGYLHVCTTSTKKQHIYRNVYYF